MKKVLLTGGGGAGNELIYRLVKDRYELFFCDSEIDNIDPSIPNTNKFSIPEANSPDFSTNLKNLCEELSIDLVIPTVDEELLQFKDFNYSDIFLPDEKYVSAMIDKYNMVKLFLSKGLNVPKAWRSSELELIDEGLFPLIVKPLNGRGSRNVELLRSKELFKYYLESNELNSEQVFFEECILGQEYTVLMAADKNKKLHAVVPVKVLSKRGVTIKAVTETNESIIRFCKSMHSVYPTKGCYNIQLIVDENGDCYPFEINPRISTTFCLSLASGVDPISIYLGEGANSTYSNGLQVFKDGISLYRHWHNHIN